MYNGNISEAQWRTANADSSLKSYTYTYDALNRITSATDNTGNYNVSNITYDKNGNIQTLNRNGWQTSSPYADMDVLGYDYDNGNQLVKVTDTGNSTHGFKDGANQTTEYFYDGNGNMTRDDNKGITNIAYSHLNLPTQISFASGNIQYIYDASGGKLRKTVTESGNTTTTDYTGGYVYENGQLQFFTHTEGYVDVDNGNYFYVYNYVDHLGNVRLTYADSDSNGSINPLTEILSEKNYYPFGLEHKGYNSAISPNTNGVAEKWRYNGKEIDEDLGLNWYHYGFRVYDPAIGRFPSIDPISDQFPHVSTHNYAENEPVGSIDLHGLQRVKVNGKVFNNDFRGSPVKLTQIRVGLANAPQSFKVGNLDRFSNNTSSVSARMSSRIGNQGNVLTQGRGSEQNALRHTLWNALSTQAVGSEMTEDLVNSHEGITPSDNVILEENEPTPEGISLPFADNTADFFNNEIGRQIGEQMPDASATEVTKHILDVFLNEGLFQVDREDGNKVKRTKISQETYNAAIKILNRLNNNGRTDDQEKAIRKQKSELGIPN